MGEYLAKGLTQLKEKHGSVTEVRGLGLLQGIELTIDAKLVVADCLKRRVLINNTGDRVLRFVPPLVISQGDIDLLLDVLSSVLNAYSA
jgi:acetylornithine aminotransferase